MVVLEVKQSIYTHSHIDLSSPLRHHIGLMGNLLASVYIILKTDTYNAVPLNWDTHIDHLLKHKHGLNIVYNIQSYLLLLHSFLYCTHISYTWIEWTCKSAHFSDECCAHCIDTMFIHTIQKACHSKSTLLHRLPFWYRFRLIINKIENTHEHDK